MRLFSHNFTTSHTEIEKTNPEETDFDVETVLHFLKQDLNATLLQIIRLVRTKALERYEAGCTAYEIVIERDFCYLKPVYVVSQRPAKISTDDLLQIAMLFRSIRQNVSEVDRLREYDFVIPDSMFQIGIMVGMKFREEHNKK